VAHKEKETPMFALDAAEDIATGLQHIPARPRDDNDL
jgi:hypothetical protein